MGVLDQIDTKCKVENGWESIPRDMPSESSSSERNQPASTEPRYIPPSKRGQGSSSHKGAKGPGVPPQHRNYSRPTNTRGNKPTNEQYRSNRNSSRHFNGRG